MAWDPQSKTFARVKERDPSAVSARPSILDDVTVPVLGGPATFRLEHRGKVWIGGPRGAFVGSKPLPAVEAPALLDYQSVPMSPLLAKQDPRLAQAPAAPGARRVGWLDDANPQNRAWAVAHLTAVAGAQFAKALHDSDSRVRAAALWRAINDGVTDAPELLKLALDDPNPRWQALATLALLERGVLPPIKYVRSAAIAAEESDFGSLTNPRDGKIYRDPRRDDFWKALAPLADEDVLAMMQELGATLRNGTHFTEELFEPIGRFIAEHPAAVKRLTDGDKLQWRTSVYTRSKKGVLSSHPDDAVGGFATHEVAAAGPAILPSIHPWLRDREPIRRRFAAIVCGRIGDHASLKPLLEAFEQDDGLALGAITKALGRLRSPEAIPALTALYPEINQAFGSRDLYGYGSPLWLRDKELLRKYSRGSATIVIGVPGAARQVSSENLRPENLPAGSEPLSPDNLIDAIEQIGPEHAQPFFRAIAKGARSRDASGSGLLTVTGGTRNRAIAARCLRPGTEAENAESIAILLEIMNEGYAGKPDEISFAAAVSPLYFNLRDGESLILRQLSEREFGYATYQNLRRLLTVPHEKRAFLDERIQGLISAHRANQSEREWLEKLLHP